MGRLVDLLQFGGELDDEAGRRDEIGEGVVAGAVTARPPGRHVALLLHATDPAHELVDRRHLEGDVVDAGIVAAHQRDRVVVRVAAQEHHLVGGIVRYAEAEDAGIELLHAFHVGRVQHHVADLARLGPFRFLVQRHRLRAEAQAAVVGIEHLEAVAAGIVPEHGRLAEHDAAALDDLRVKRVHGGAIRHGEMHIFDAEDRAVLEPVQERLAAGSAQQRDAVLPVREAQAPHVLVERQGLGDAGPAHHDASKTADANGLCHVSSPLRL